MEDCSNTVQKTPSSNAQDVHIEERKFINVLFHSKGMDMVNLPSLFHNKK